MKPPDDPTSVDVGLSGRIPTVDIRLSSGVLGMLRVLARSQQGSWSAIRKEPAVERCAARWPLSGLEFAGQHRTNSVRCSLATSVPAKQKREQGPLALHLASRQGRAGARRGWARGRSALRTNADRWL